jgi:hypothetical protein
MQYMKLQNSINASINFIHELKQDAGISKTSATYINFNN